jgi:DNA-binding NtrC family response regulator
VVEDDPDMQALLIRRLERVGHRVSAFDSAEEFFEAYETLLPDAVCLDLQLPGMLGMDALKTLQARAQGLAPPVIMFTAEREVSSVVAAMQAGAFDYLAKPVEKTKLLATIRNAIRQHRMSIRLHHLDTQADQSSYFGIFGESAPMRELFRQMERLSFSDVPVFVHGESGTGKELVARALHDASTRAKGPFVAVNCAAIPESLMDAELFGHEKGAFTGAGARRPGCFEQADGGTLFLDEIAELDAQAQAKILRAIQERRFRRVGGTRDIESDFRLVTASHRDLATQARMGAFREDLFFRVAVFELHVPALRARSEDRLALAARFASEYSGGKVTLSAETQDAIQAYPWPGNVRELQNAIQRALIVCRDEVVEPTDFPPRITGVDTPPLGADERNDEGADVSRSLEDLEKQALVDALERAKGNVSQVVRELGIGRTTVYRKMKKYGLRDS